MVKMPKVTKKEALSSLVVGAAVVMGTAPLTGILNSVLGFIPSTELWGLIVPHGALAAGTVAYVASLLTAKYIIK